MIYNGDRTSIKSIGIKEIIFKDTILADEFHNFSFNATIENEKSWLKIYDRLVDRSLAIEGVPGTNEEECIQPGLENLKMIQCKGKIKVKPNDD